MENIRAKQLRRLITEDFAGSQSALSARCGVSLSQLGQYLGGYRNIGEKTARKIEMAAKKQVGWLDSLEPRATPENSGLITIQQYETGGSMGHGFTLTDVPPGVIHSWSVTPEWLRLNVPVHSGLQNLCIVTGFGPSMQPRYNPGDPLLCDRGVTEVLADGVYFFRVEGHGFIKQLQRVPTAAGVVLRAKSFNLDYEPFDILPSMDFQVLGRILTVWRSEQF